MAKVIDAVYENGVLWPLEKIDIPEHRRLKIILENTEEPVSHKECSLDGIIDVAPDCSDTDLSTHHDKYLYGEVTD